MNQIFISRYRIVEEIGRGGMGIVYKAEDPRLERLVAVKILPPKLLKNKEALRRFLREAKVAAKLDHPNIIPIYDVGEHEGTYYMVMEYLEGKTLREWLESRPSIDIQKGLQVFRQIALALDYAHRRKVIHRDVKPENVVVLPDQTLKVMDFGIAVMDDRHSVTQTGAVLGTISYIAPEQAQGGKADERSDIYSLGIILFEVLTGQLPFQATTPSQMLSQHLHTPPPLPSSINVMISRTLDLVSRKSLSKNPDERYQTVSELLQELEPKNTTHDSFEKYRPAVEQMKKDAVLEAHPSALTGDMAELQKTTPKVPCVRCSALNVPTQRYCLTCGSLLVGDPLAVGSALEKGIALYLEQKYEEALQFFETLSKKDPKAEGLPLYLGLCHLRLKRSREALTSFQKEIELHPNNAVAWEAMGDAAHQLSLHTDARHAYTEALKLASSALLWLKLGSVEEALGKLDEAKRAYGKAKELEASNPMVLKKYAECCIKLSQFEEAHQVLSRLLELDRNDPETHRLLGQIYEQTNRYSQALQSYEKALAINPNDSIVLSRLGNLHGKQNKTDLAITHLTNSLKTGEQNADTLAKLGELYLKKEDIVSAAACFEKASELSPNTPELHRDLGKLYLKKNDLDRAMLQLEWAISLDPADAESHTRLGQIYLKRDQTQLSIREFKTAIHLDPYNPELHESIGMVYYTREEFEKAIEAMQRAVTLDPENVDYRKALGVMYESKGKIDLARKEYQKAVDTNPKDALAQGLLGRVYLQQELTHLAVYQLQKSVELDPHSRLIHSLLGKAYLRLEQYQSAATTFRKALELAKSPNNNRGDQILGKSYFYLGQSLFRVGDLEEAESSLVQCIRLIPNFSKAFHFLGKIQLTRGEKLKGIQFLERAARYAPEDPEVFSELLSVLDNPVDLGAVIRDFAKISQSVPEESQFCAFLGELYFKNGEANEAIQALQKALLLSPKNVNYRQILAKVYESQGNIKEALAELETAKKHCHDEETLSLLKREIQRLKS